jgi:energy-dependent translational throttle protein EttA
MLKDIVEARPLGQHRLYVHFEDGAEGALLDFAGCAIVISHDRWFLDRIATHILAFEGNSHVEWFEGNFEDHESDKKKRLRA